MQTTRYQFQKDIENANSNNADWLKQAFRSILESEKHFTSKADYIGYSILSVDEKIQAIEEQIKELNVIKKQLKDAKEVALSVGAEMFDAYGIDKLEGGGISSITVTQGKESTTTQLQIYDEDALIDLGYYIKSLDKERVIQEFSKADERARLQSYCDVVIQTTTSFSKLKINKRRLKEESEMNIVKLSDFIEPQKASA
jgi:hypothetical protein